MPATLFDEIKRYVGFTGEDAERLKSLGVRLRPLYDDIVNAFYDRLLQHDRAKAVLVEGKAQLDRLRRVFRRWLEELFSGRYDDDYLQRRAAIGRTHVRVQLPQHYMLTGMSVVRLRLMAHLRDLGFEPDDPHVRAVHRILDIDLSIMLDAYREDLINQLREVEQIRYEQRLSESRHLATVGQLAASLAHEIKNPLAGISGALQIIGSDLPEDHPRRDVLQEALVQIDRLDAAVRDLLIFARPTAPVRKPQSLSSLVQRCLVLLADEPALRDRAIRTELPEQEVFAHVDDVQIQQVLANLLINAAHACGPDDEVICRLRDDGGWVQLQVEDSGRGMTQDVAARAFEPFFTTKAKGTGLGLVICRRIVEAHGGQIQLESEPGVGTRVTLSLPKQG